MKYYNINERFQLENGESLSNVRIAYHTFGSLNHDKSNVIWVCHALTADSDVVNWWEELFKTNKAFDKTENFIVCANILGSHYGSTNPLSTNPKTGKPYFKTFPKFTIRDISNLHIKLANHLKLENIKILVGGSIGGQQALEWSIMEPSRIKNLVLIATNALHSAWGIAFNETQRSAIEGDDSWKKDGPNAGINGMKVARAVALLSYRNYKRYNETQSDSLQINFPTKAGNYQKYQGDKLAKRFNAYSYWYLSKAMDSHNVGRNRNGIPEALGKIKANTLILSMKNDLLFPEVEQKTLEKYIPNSKQVTVQTDYGHDGFLIETKQIDKLINEHLKIKQDKPTLRAQSC